MFSTEDIEDFSIKVKLPYPERRGTLIEQFVNKYPLSTLKFHTLQNILFKLQKMMDATPTIALEGSGAVLTVSKEELALGFREEEAVEISEVQKKPKDLSPYSENKLKLVSADFNFIFGGILALLNLNSLASKGYISVSKHIDYDLRLDKFLMPNFWDRLKVFEEKHISGIQLEFDGLMKGIKTHNITRFSMGRENGQNRTADVNIVFRFELKEPIDLGLIIKDRLETINTLYQRLIEVT